MARPPKRPEDRQTVNINIRMTEARREMVRALARRRGMGLTEYINWLIDLDGAAGAGRRGRK